MRAGHNHGGSGKRALDAYPRPAGFCQSCNHEFTFLCDLSAGLGYADGRSLPHQRTTEKAVVANSNERLHPVLAKLEECRAALIDGGNRETALLVSVAILDLRMKLHEIADSELKALCEAIAPDGVLERRSPDSKSPLTQRLPPVLKLVK
jgi:hypothetical protein